jgi:hypothetical protein
MAFALSKSLVGDEGQRASSFSAAACSVQAPARVLATPNPRLLSAKAAKSGVDPILTKQKALITQGFLLGG